MKIYDLLAKLKLAYSDPVSLPDRAEIMTIIERGDGLFGSTRTQENAKRALEEIDELDIEFDRAFYSQVIVLVALSFTLWFLANLTFYVPLMIALMVLYVTSLRRSSVIFTQLMHLQGYIDGCMETLLFTTDHLENIKEKHEQEMAKKKRSRRKKSVIE